MIADGLATRQPLRLRADHSRVIAQLFVPGHALPGGSEGHASEVVDHIVSLSDDEVDTALESVMRRFGARHADLAALLRHHAERIHNRLDRGVHLSEARWLLLGATFTQELTVDGAALCNPSAVALPDQTNVPSGSVRFVMSVRQIGEGHRSSVGFRRGVVDVAGVVTIGDLGRYTTVGTVEPSVLDTASLSDGSEAAAWALDRLGDHCTRAELEERLEQLESQQDTRRDVVETVRNLRELASRTYTTRFASSSTLAERVLYPATAAESNGIEDARFVRFTEDDGAVRYYATYTAFDGHAIAQQLIATDDFETFSSSPLRGAAARNKGLALFPRRIGGRYAALSRFDGASNAVAYSNDLRRWATAETITAPRSAWETVQVGNCGPPIETDAGWLVLTHGVGPMRTYSIGAWLLDLDDPTKLVGRLREPLLAPSAEEQAGYVPNVVYSCGALAAGDHLVIPYGIGDASIGFATASIPQLIDAMTAT